MSPSSVLKLPVHGECTFCESGANEILLDVDKRTSIIHVCLRIRTHKTDYFPAENKKRMLSFHWIRCQHSQGHVFAVNWRQDSFPQGLLTLSPTFLRRFFPCHFEFLSSLFKCSCVSEDGFIFGLNIVQQTIRLHSARPSLPISSTNNRTGLQSSYINMGDHVSTSAIDQFWY